MGEGGVHDGQWNDLLDFITSDPKNNDMITNQATGANGVVGLNNKWIAAANYVNKVGGANKTGEQWKEAFRGLKTRAKQKYAAKTGYQLGTGGRPDPDTIGLGLKAVHVRVLGLVNKKCLHGDKSIPDALALQMNNQWRQGQQQQPPHQPAEGNLGQNCYVQQQVVQHQAYQPPSQQQLQVNPGGNVPQQPVEGNLGQNYYVQQQVVQQQAYQPPSQQQLQVNPGGNVPQQPVEGNLGQKFYVQQQHPAQHQVSPPSAQQQHQQQRLQAYHGGNVPPLNNQISEQNFGANLYGQQQQSQHLQVSQSSALQQQPPAYHGGNVPHQPAEGSFGQKLYVQEQHLPVQHQATQPLLLQLHGNGVGMTRSTNHHPEGPPLVGSSYVRRQADNGTLAGNPQDLQHSTPAKPADQKVIRTPPSRDTPVSRKKLSFGHTTVNNMEEVTDNLRNVDLHSSSACHCKDVNNNVTSVMETVGEIKESIEALKLLVNKNTETLQLLPTRAEFVDQCQEVAVKIQSSLAGVEDQLRVLNTAQSLMELHNGTN